MNKSVANGANAAEDMNLGCLSVKSPACSIAPLLLCAVLWTRARHFTASCSPVARCDLRVPDSTLKFSVMLLCALVDGSSRV